MSLHAAILLSFWLCILSNVLPKANGKEEFLFTDYKSCMDIYCFFSGFMDLQNTIFVQRKHAVRCKRFVDDSSKTIRKILVHLCIDFCLPNIVKLFSFGILAPLKSILYNFFLFYLGILWQNIKKMKKNEKLILAVTSLVAAGSWGIYILEKLSIHKIPVECTFDGVAFCVLAIFVFLPQ